MAEISSTLPQQLHSEQRIDRFSVRKGTETPRVMARALGGNQGDVPTGLTAAPKPASRLIQLLTRKVEG